MALAEMFPLRVPLAFGVKTTLKFTLLLGARVTGNVDPATAKSLVSREYPRNGDAGSSRIGEASGL